MYENRWACVDEYFSGLFAPDDATLASALENSDIAGLPPHHVSPCQGQLLYILAKIQHARRILEIGTLGAYSTLWLARAIDRDGTVVTIESNKLHRAVAQKNIEMSGLQDRIALHLGDAREVLRRFIDRKTAPFDMIFIDADKPNNPEYLELVLRLSRPGTLIVGDNVVRDGEVANNNASDHKVQGARRFCELLSDPGRFATAAVQTVGVKGYDGFTLSIVKA